MNDSDNPWEIISSEYLHKAPWLTVRKDHVVLPNGNHIPSYYILEYPDLKKVRFIYAASAEHQLYVQCYTQYDLMTICDFNGNLKCNIYGPKWVNEKTQTQHYSLGVEFCGDKILALYSGGDHRTDAYYPTKFLVFDLNGNYLKTLETGYMITDFCYDKENNRLIINLNDEIQFAYLDLEGII